VKHNPENSRTHHMKAQPRYPTRQLKYNLRKQKVRWLEMSLEEVSNAINAQFKHQNRLVKPRSPSLLRTRKNWDSIIGGYSTECGARM